jgi:hypothetical protein
MCCEEEEGQAVQGSDRDNGTRKNKGNAVIAN